MTYEKSALGLKGPSKRIASPNTYMGARTLISILTAHRTTAAAWRFLCNVPSKRTDADEGVLEGRGEGSLGQPLPPQLRARGMRCHEARERRNTQRSNCSTAMLCSARTITSISSSQATSKLPPRFQRSSVLWAMPAGEMGRRVRDGVAQAEKENAWPPVTSVPRKQSVSRARVRPATCLPSGHMPHSNR